MKLTTDRLFIRSLQAEAEEGDRDSSDALWPVIERRNGRLVGHCGILKKEVDGKKAGLVLRGETVRPSGKRMHVYVREIGDPV